jgi:RHS repeat-associated protein
MGADFCNPLINPEYIDLAFAYTGRLLDKATGLQNNLNRWYDASVGRWLSEDPIGFSAGDANLYRYVGNGPVNGADPSGLDPAFAPTIGIGSPFLRPDPVLPKTYPISELDKRFGPGIKPITDRLCEIRDEIEKGGGIAIFRFTNGSPGYRCSEADELVQKRLLPLRDTGWEYEHEESDGWIFDHNWGHVYGPNGEQFYIDFWTDPERPIWFRPPR